MKTLIASLLVVSSFSALAAPKYKECANTVAELRTVVANTGFPTAWKEIGAGDGKPLKLTISDRNGLLLMDFMKDGKVFAQASATICKEGSNFMAQVNGADMVWGPAAPGMLVGMMGKGSVTVKLSLPYTNQLKVGIKKGLMGWDGKFEPN